MLLRSGSFALLACLFVLAGGAAHAARPKQAVFRVSLSATLTKEWTYTHVDPESACTRTTRGTGRWQTTLSTRRAARLRATSAGRGRVRFSGSLYKVLGGTVTQAGSTTTTAGGSPPCERFTRSVRCEGERRRFRDASAAVLNPRRGVIQLGRLRGAGAIRFRSDCLALASDIQTIYTDMPLASAPLDAADMFARNVPRFFVSGDVEQVTTLEGDLEGRVTERVRWRLAFTRLGR